MFKGLLLVFNKNHELQRETQENLNILSIFTTTETSLLVVTEYSF